MPHNAINTRLSAEQVQFFNQNGYLIIDIGLKTTEIDSAVGEMLPQYESVADGRPFWPGIRIQDGWKDSAAVKNIALNTYALDCLEQLFGRKALPFQTLNFPVGTQQKAHSDTIHFNSKPSGFMAGVWVALEDVNMDNGALVYYPGSHQWPEYNMQDVGKGIGYENYKHYEAFIQEKLSESGIEPFYAELKKGQALIWHANLIHGGTKPEKTGLTRHSQVTHYYFEGCRYFTPMNSSNEEIHWRNPQWISHNPNIATQARTFFKRKVSKIKQQFFK